METQHDNKDFARQYDESVRQEREARQALHSHPPGTPERERAWDAWSQAIAHTNKAWRRFSASRITHPGQRPLPANAHHHANA